MAYAPGAYMPLFCGQSLETLSIFLIGRLGPAVRAQRSYAGTAEEDSRRGCQGERSLNTGTDKIWDMEASPPATTRAIKMTKLPVT
jgi:hypothetical protein